MGIIKNSIDFGSGFNIKAQGPIDSRMVVEYISDLTNVWNSDAPAYEGMAVSVLEDGNIYVLRNVDFSKIDNWKKQGAELPNMDDYALKEDLPDMKNYYTMSEVNNLIEGVESLINSAKTLTEEILG